MGIYAGVNGVTRKATQPRVGVNAVTRTVSHGFNGVDSIRRQFFGKLEDVARVEVRPERIVLYDMDASGDTTYRDTFTSPSGINSYGYVSISGDSVGVCCNTRGKYFLLDGHVYAVFSNGREAPLSWVTTEGANYGLPEYGAALSFPVGYYQYTGGNDYTQSAYLLDFCGKLLYSSYVDTSVSGTATLTACANSLFDVGAGVKTGFGSSTTRMSFSDVTIDGRSVPVQVVSKLKD